MPELPTGTVTFLFTDRASLIDNDLATMSASCHKRAIHSGHSRSLEVPHEVRFVPLTWMFARTCWSGV